MCKIAKILMLMLEVWKSIDQMVMANSVHSYGHVLRRAMKFRVEGKGKKRT